MASLTSNQIIEYYKKLGYNINVIRVSSVMSIDTDEDVDYPYQYFIYMEQAEHISQYFHQHFHEKYKQFDLRHYNNALKVNIQGQMGLELFIY